MTTEGKSEEWRAKSSTTAVPAPGSDEAVAQGCTCPIIDNGHGRGYRQTAAGGPLYIKMAGCPLHWPGTTPAIETVAP